MKWKSKNYIKQYTEFRFEIEMFEMPPIEIIIILFIVIN